MKICNLHQTFKVNSETLNITNIEIFDNGSPFMLQIRKNLFTFMVILVYLINYKENIYNKNR